MTTSNKSFAPTWVIIVTSLVVLAIVAFALANGQVQNLSSVGY